jgi:phosphomannomutase/phosphoglucomutase
VVVLRFEADNATALERIQADFRQALQSVWPASFCRFKGIS